MRLHHAKDPGVRSGKILTELQHRSEEHERGGGGHFSPRQSRVARCFRKHRSGVTAPFFGRDSAGADQWDRRGKGSEFSSVSEGYGEEGKLASQPET